MTDNIHVYSTPTVLKNNAKQYQKYKFWGKI